MPFISKPTVLEDWLQALSLLIKWSTGELDLSPTIPKVPALPWRLAPKPYSVYISEIMLQQTRVATVINYFNAWMVRFPGLKNIAEADQADVLHYWQGLGYYSRAMNIHKTAQSLANRDYHLPKHLESLLELPGIGDYTAKAILSFADGQSFVAVDANLLRIGRRLLGNSQVDKTTVETLFQPYLQEFSSAKLNAALMDLGRLVCLRPTPKCACCPLNCICLSASLVKGKLPDILPKAKRVLTNAQLIYCIAKRGKKILVLQPRQAWWKKLYTFPYIVLNGAGTEILLPGEFNPAWLVQHLQPNTINKLARFNYKALAFVTHYRLEVVLVEIPTILEKALEKIPNAEWLQIETLEQKPLPSPMRKAVDWISQTTSN